MGRDRLRRGAVATDQGGGREGPPVRAADGQRRTGPVQARLTSGSPADRHPAHRDAGLACIMETMAPGPQAAIGRKRGRRASDKSRTGRATPPPKLIAGGHVDAMRRLLRGR